MQLYQYDEDVTSYEPMLLNRERAEKTAISSLVVPQKVLTLRIRGYKEGQQQQQHSDAATDQLVHGSVV